MKRVITLIFVVLRLTSSAQSNTADYTLTIHFGPAFHNSSQLIIRSNHNSCYAQLSIGSDFVKKVRISSANLNDLSIFLRSYKFRIRGSTDTIGSNKEFVDGDSVMVYHVVSGLDGIIVSGSLDQNNESKKFQFWSPKNRNPENELLAKILINIMQSAFKDKASMGYTKALKTYFD